MHWSEKVQFTSIILVLFGIQVSNSVQFLVWQDDDAVNAEAFINKASFKVNNIKNEVLNLQYKVVIIWSRAFLIFEYVTITG